MNKIYYNISYDNFYMSNEIVTLDNINKLIDRHIESASKYEYTALFSCNDLDDYIGYELIQCDNDTYTLKINFKDDEYITVTLYKCVMYE